LRVLASDYDSEENPMISEFQKNQSGATAIEYGLIAALIALVIITALTTVGTSLSANFTSIAGSLR